MPPQPCSVATQLKPVCAVAIGSNHMLCKCIQTQKHQACSASVQSTIKTINRSTTALQHQVELISLMHCRSGSRCTAVISVPKLVRTRLAMSALRDCESNASTTKDPWELLALPEAIASELVLHGLSGGLWNPSTAPLVTYEFLNSQRLGRKQLSANSSSNLFMCSNHAGKFVPPL